jgi:hypothetical protein
MGIYDEAYSTGEIDNRLSCLYVIVLDSVATKSAKKGGNKK